MKLLLPLISLLIASAALAEEPAELVELRQAWEKERTEAQEKIDKLYFDELEQLKKNFTQARNIADALAVANVIKGGEKADNEPAELSKMRQARNKSLKKVLTPLDKKYWQDLKKLKEDFIKEGKLVGVVATDAEIKKVLAAYKKPEAPKQVKTTGEENPLEGTWIVTLSPGQASTTYKIKGGDIKVIKSHYLRVGDSAKMKKYKDGWIVNFEHPSAQNRPITEYFHLEKDKLTVHHWTVNQNPEAGPHSHTATVIEVEDDKEQ
jgi:hypothetical protein